MLFKYIIKVCFHRLLFVDALFAPGIGKNSGEEDRGDLFFVLRL